MARQTRLGLAENFGKLHHAEHAARHQRQDAQAGGFGTGAQTIEEIVHAPHIV